MIQQIKEWLRTNNRDREWLGKQVDTHKRTVDNWLSAGQPIPEAKLALIKRLMADDAAAEAQRSQQKNPVAQVFSLEVDLPTFRAYSQAARDAQNTLEDWAVNELDKAADEYFAEKRGVSGLNDTRFTGLNETPKPYGGS
jgi:hypothetical protein